MENKIPEVVKQADILIKQGDFERAWKLLLPQKGDPAAHRRLVWLKQRHQLDSQTGSQLSTQLKPNQQNRSYRTIALVVILLGLGVLAVYAWTQQAVIAPSATGAPTLIANVPRIYDSTDAVATNIPPTEIPLEAGLQQQLRDWLLTVDGVRQVMTLDVDVPGDEPPLVYAEIVVDPGQNNARIPDLFMRKLNVALDTAKYSDLVIIVDDDLKVIEYSFGSGAGVWQQTELTLNESTSQKYNRHTPRPIAAV